MYCKSSHVFYIKRKYSKFDSTPQEDLDLSRKVCHSLFDQLNENNCPVELGVKAKEKLQKTRASLFTHGQKLLVKCKRILFQVM